MVMGRRITSDKGEQRNSFMIKANNREGEWPSIEKSLVAQSTTNPIRNVVDRLKIPPNPQKTLISLGLGTGLHPSVPLSKG